MPATNSFTTPCFIRRETNDFIPEYKGPKFAGQFENALEEHVKRIASFDARLPWFSNTYRFTGEHDAGKNLHSGWVRVFDYVASELTCTNQMLVLCPDMVTGFANAFREMECLVDVMTLEVALYDGTIDNILKTRQAEQDVENLARVYQHARLRQAIHCRENKKLYGTPATAHTTTVVVN